MTKRNPTWTPPINGWRYRLHPVGKHGGLTIDKSSNMTLFRDQAGGLWLTNYGSIFAGDYIKGIGSLRFCCRVLDAALRGGK